MKNYKKMFPVTNNYIFLNNAAESPMNIIYREALNEYLDTVCESPHTKPGMRLEVKKRLSKLIGGLPSDYALITSTGIGAGIVAKGINFEDGDNIVTFADEHRNNLFPWLSLKDKGVQVRFVDLNENGSINYKDVERLIDDRTRLVAVSAVRFNSGFRVDLKLISGLAHSLGAILYVDGIQALGVAPINVDDMGIDVLSAGGFKWLLGSPGTGFLYVSPNVRAKINPVMPGMFSAEESTVDLNYYDDSRKYETGSISYSLFYAWQKSLDFLIETGVENIFDRVIELTNYLIDGLKKRNIKILSDINSIKERSAILFFSLGNEELNNMAQVEFEKAKIIISVRDGKCRVSPSFYNTKEEIETFFNVLDDIRANILK